MAVLARASLLLLSKLRLLLNLASPILTLPAIPGIVLHKPLTQIHFKLPKFGEKNRYH